MPDESNEELGYLSSARPNLRDQKTTSVDEPYLPAMLRAIEIFEAKIAMLNSNDSLYVQGSPFTVEQQLAINQQLVAELREVKMLVQTAIEELKGE